MSKIARIFPRKTNATPDDDLAFIGEPGLFLPECDEVHVSVTFDYDLKEAKRVAGAWADRGYKVKIGGPALDDPGEDFIPGMYLKKGYVITSRGCPNRCWFCSVWKREGDIRELPITEGWNVLDSNILACSEKHIMAVFDMLDSQRRRPEFTGGLDPKLITLEIAKELKRIRPRRIYTAYDTPDDFVHLLKASDYLFAAGFTAASHILMCYVLIGYKGDSIQHAEMRLEGMRSIGLTPMAMLYRNGINEPSVIWKQFQRKWARPAIIHAPCGPA